MPEPDSQHTPSSSPDSGGSPKPVPARFQVAPATLRLDRFMTHAIKVGGVTIIVAVFGILVFILFQILPLFKGAAVEEMTRQQIATENPWIIGLDEWSELPFTYSGGTSVLFTDLKGDRGSFEIKLPFDLEPEEVISAARFHPHKQHLVVGTSKGRFAVITIKYSPAFGPNNERTINASLDAGDLYPIGQPGFPIVNIDYGDSGDAKLVAAIQETGTGTEHHVVTLKQKQTLLGAGKIEPDKAFDLTADLPENPQYLLVPAQANAVIVSSASGEVAYSFLDRGEFSLRQTFSPFKDLDDPGIARVDFVFGDVSLVFSGVNGEQRVFSLFRPENEPDRIFGQTKSFPPLPGPATFFVASQRNKTFICGLDRFASLRNSTTETVRWQDTLPFEINAAALDRKGETLAFLDDAGVLHLYDLHDPHPEAGWKAFFGKIWYEGASGPDYVWQSGGGSDDLEPKLSMVPLIFGSLKGTLYAMIFAVPIAILSAIYTAHFLHPPVKRIVKPTMEIMASLPSVVLGFLAALWLAPIIETRVPSIILILLALPTAAIVFGQLWNRLPIQYRNAVRPGHEYLIFTPIMLLIMWAMWQLGPAFEKLLFVVTDPETGAKTADFRLWWPEVTGTPFDQRNSLVVGFMMGFAVIPVIFTIAEDSLSNVPPSLTAASAALGASRWQTVRTIVIPIASAGIFSALMIGFGRAVGETMIVVMATGNTPIMDWNIFSGMRTLSANIAVELPEAPVHSTHYRTLFLGALVLFALTFVLNTVAEILRQHLREKFKLV
ncbi:MAG: ABC transporter permease subunit [Verrucomicrobiota bacterium]